MGSKAAWGSIPESIGETLKGLDQQGYLADEALATCLYLALRMQRPLFLEGEPGVGKTELAKVVAKVLDTRLIRLQCYEGLDLNQSVYEWDYPRQLLEIQARGSGASHEGEGIADLFSEKFLLKRPLLQAIEASHDQAPVLLIDELDRADEEFESFLLELLADFQVTVPELGTLKAEHKPVVFLTSNRTREIHDALKRRCVYHWIEYPSFEKELAIVRRKVPGLEEQVSRQAVAFIQKVREQDLYKLPGVAETLDWAEALCQLDLKSLDAAAVGATLGFFLKHQDDIEQLRDSTAEILNSAQAIDSEQPHAAESN
ncbi:MAG TPA: MoxR family ATPase [Acidobacteriota bacterium]|nr:MoxR family ATPase [Acidobacteriota bacterium]